MLAALAVVAVAAVAARDAVYWEKPLPASRSATSSSTGRSPSSWTARAYDVAPRGAPVDSAATERAQAEAGRDSFRTRVRALADPSPPRIWVEPVLEPRRSRGARGATRARARRSPAGRRSSRRGETFVAIPARPGAEVDAAPRHARVKAAAPARERIVAPLLRSRTS